MLDHPTYRCLVVDPPWPQKGAGTLQGREGWHDSQGNSKAMPYPVMSLDQIAAMSLASLAAPEGCHLYLWATNHFLPDAFDVLRAWGFIYSTTNVWAKNPMGGGLGGAFGISTEFFLYAKRGSLPALSRVRGTWHNWKRPYNEYGKPKHSAKPKEFYELVERVSPGPRLDLFSRQQRPGWDAWGDQAPNAIMLPALERSA